LCFGSKRCRAGPTAPPSSSALSWTGFPFDLPSPTVCRMPRAGPRLGGFPALRTTDSTTSAACSSLREDPEPRPTNLGPSQLFPLTERSLETKKAPAFSPALFFRKIALGPLASYQLPHLRQPLCQPPLPHLRPPLPQFRQPLCQLPHPVNCMPLWSDVDLVCSTIAVRTRATRSEIVA